MKSSVWFTGERPAKVGQDQKGVYMYVCVCGAVSYWEQWWREVGTVGLGKAQADGGYKSKGTGGKKRQNKMRALSLMPSFLQSNVAN